MGNTTRDGVILGGGLAGLTLALQWRGECPELDIVVVERSTHPLPQAAHKVGESLVEIGAHYLADTLGAPARFIATQPHARWRFNVDVSDPQRDHVGATSWSDVAIATNSGARGMYPDGCARDVGIVNAGRPCKIEFGYLNRARLAAKASPQSGNKACPI